MLIYYERKILLAQANRMNVYHLLLPIVEKEEGILLRTWQIDRIGQRKRYDPTFRDVRAGNAGVCACHY
jgi:hypothetical protein